MGLDIMWVTGLIVIVAIFIVIYAILYSKSVHRDGKKAKYDERQMAVRGRGYMFAFYTAVIVSVIPCFFTDEMKLFFGNLLYFIPLIVGMMVHTFYCVWNDAYIELNLDSKKWMTSISCIGFANLMIGIGNCSKGLLIDGEINSGIISLIFGIFAFLVLLELRVKSSLNKKKEAEEDEEFEA